MAFVIPPLDKRQCGQRFECCRGWYRLSFCEGTLYDEPVFSGFDPNTAGYSLSRYSTSRELSHYTLFRGSSFPEEAGVSPSVIDIERAAFWNDSLLVSFDSNRGEWRILCNRAASIPVFWKTLKGCTVVSNSMSALGEHTEKPDRIAFAESLIWDLPLRARTLQEGISQLQAGYKLVITADGAKAQKSHLLEFGSGRTTMHPVDLVRKAADLNIRAVELAIRPSERLIVPISGGLDSRCILGAIPPNALHRCSAVSFGQQYSLEMPIGRVVARACGVPWTRYILNANHYTRDFTEAIYEGYGLLPLQHLHLYSALLQCAFEPSQVLTGFMGDPVAGADAHHTSDILNKDQAVKAMLLKAGLTIERVEELFGSETVAGIVNDIEWLFEDVTSHNSSSSFWEYYFIVERQSKLITHIFNTLNFAGHILGFPFMDGEWARFYLSLPPKFRVKRYLFRNVLKLQRPDLARIMSTDNFASITASPFLQEYSRHTSVWLNRICTLSQRITGYRYSLPNPFATELQGVILRGTMKERLAIAVDELFAYGLLSDSLSKMLRGKYCLRYPGAGFRTITLAEYIRSTDHATRSVC